MKNRVFAFVVSQVLALFLFTAAFAQGFEPTQGQQSKAEDFVLQWLSLLDAGDYQTAYDLKTLSLQRMIPYKAWAVEEAAFRNESGKALERKVGTVYWYQDPPNAAPGLYVVIDTYGTFENINTHKMVVTMIMDDDLDLQVLRTERSYADKGQEKEIRELQVATEGRRFLTAEISEKEWQSYLNEILILSSWQSSVQQGQIIIVSAEPSTTYVFTTTDHFAHPSVIRREVIEKDGAIYIDMIGYYAGEKSEFDNWWNQFKELNQRVMERVNSTSK